MITGPRYRCSSGAASAGSAISSLISLASHPSSLESSPIRDYQGALDTLPFLFFIAQILAGRKRLEELGVTPADFSAEPQNQGNRLPILKGEDNGEDTREELLD